MSVSSESVHIKQLILNSWVLWAMRAPFASGCAPLVVHEREVLRPILGTVPCMQCRVLEL